MLELVAAGTLDTKIRLEVDRDVVGGASEDAGTVLEEAFVDAYVDRNTSSVGNAAEDMVASARPYEAGSSLDKADVAYSEELANKAYRAAYVVDMSAVARRATLDGGSS